MGMSDLTGKLRVSLNSKGLRMTRQRRAILDAARRLAPAHFGVPDLLDEIARGGEGVFESARATVYRTLELFVEFGILRKLQLESRASVFELVSETAHHEHLVCVSCGNTIEFVSHEIERLQDEICRELEFEPTSHLLRISGICKNCRSSGAHPE